MIIKTGDKFGRLTAVKFNHYKNHHQHWLFRCDCGKEKVINASSVKIGLSKSCGCFRKENGKILGLKNKTHGMDSTKIYNCWQGMKQRCLNKNNRAYKHYGGRGITICKEWLTFENFYKDMGDKPEGLSIDRINNDKGYYKNNCQWATPTEQNNNTRKNVKNNSTE